MAENKLGTIISKLRKEKGLTQKDLADKLNISDKAVSRWETGHSSPNMDMLLRISKFFNVPLNDLITARVSTDEEDDGIVQEIIQEFSEMKKKNSQRIKMVLLVALVIVLILTIAIIFTNTYNRFKVYRVNFESNDIYFTKGIYVETNIKDTLHLGNIKIKGYEVKDSDTISVDLYFIKDENEYILQSYSSLDNLNFSNYQSYIEIDNLSKYFDELYIKITIVNAKGKQQEYIAKLRFVLDFSNNKIFYTEDTNYLNTKSTNLSTNEIKKILLDNGFEETNYNILLKKKADYTINYISSSNKISINYEKNKLSYRYTYQLNNNILNVRIFDENTTEIENYTYDITNNKVIECKTGRCNNYEHAMKVMNDNVLNLLYEK